MVTIRSKRLLLSSRSLQLCECDQFTVSNVTLGPSGRGLTMILSGGRGTVRRVLSAKVLTKKKIVKQSVKC